MDTVNPTVIVKPNDVPVPADYAALGVVSGYVPRPPEGLRFFLVGPAGEGKSTFLASTSDTLILDFEIGVDAIPGARATRVVIGNYKHYEQMLDKLVADAEAKKRHYKRVGIDTGDEWMHMIAGQLTAEHKCEDITEYGSKGHGWGLIRNRCWAGIQRLQMAGYSWTVVGHLTERTVTDPTNRQDITVIRPVMFDSLAKQILRNSDFHTTIWRSITSEQEMEEITVAGRKITKPKKEMKVVKKWFFDCRTLANRQGKERGVPTMKEKFEIPLIGGWDKFVEEYNLAIEKVKKGDLTCQQT